MTIADSQKSAYIKIQGKGTMADELCRSDVGEQGEACNLSTQPMQFAREEPEAGRKKGCGRWGCGCLALFALCYFVFIILSSYRGYKEREAWQAVPAQLLRGPCDAGRDKPLQSAVIGEATYSGFSPVYGCGKFEPYHRLAKIERRHYRRVQTEGAVEAGPEERERFKWQFDKYTAKGECRAMPTGALVAVAEHRDYAPYAAQVRLQGEDAVWWVACSGLKAP